MNNYDDFFFNGNFDIRRERVLDSSNDKQESEIDERKASEDYINTIYDSFEKAADKANIIMNYSSKVAANYRIPVPKESLEIRSALYRQSVDEDFIEFATFQSCVEKIEAEATKVNFSVIDTKLTADPLANERIIKTKIGQNSGEDSIGGLLSLASQFGVLYGIHKISAMWRSEETAATAPPLSAPEAIKEAVEGIAASFAILGINQTLEFLNNQSINTVKNSNIKGLIEEAKQVKLPPLIELVKQQMSESDHKIIIKYCLNYITSTNEKGYEFWMAYYNARKARYLSKRTRSLAPLFSEKYNNEVFNTTSFVDPSQSRAIPGPLTQVANQVVDILNASITYPTDIYMCAQDYEASNFEVGLNRIVQILDTKFSRDAICCFIRYFSKIDIDILKKIRALLSIYSSVNLIDLNRTIENFEAYLLSWVKETIEHLIFALINLIIDKIVKIVAKFVNDITVDGQLIAECPLVLELLQRVIDAMIMIMSDVREIANNYIKSIVFNGLAGIGLSELDASANASDTSLYKIHKKRMIGQIIQTLDSIINAVDSGSVFCEERTGKPNEITFDEFLDKNFQNSNDNLNIPDNLKKQYFSDASEVKFQDGSKLPGYNIGVIDIGSQDGSASDTDCVDFLNSLLPNDLLNKYIR